MLIISCQVLRELLERLLPDELLRQARFLDYGLHRVPQHMTQEIQRQIDSLDEPRLVVLGYGLCGNGLNGVRSGRHTLLVPRVDDCIALLLGSRKAYLEEFSRVPGTYYLSKGWIESGSHPLSEYEEYSATYGAEEAQWILDQQYQHYDRLALVAHSSEDMEAYRHEAREVAQYCARWGMVYEEILGSDAYVRRLVELSVALLDDGRVTLDPRAKRDFVLVGPGGKLRTNAFVAGSPGVDDGP